MRERYGTCRGFPAGPEGGANLSYPSRGPAWIKPKSMDRQPHERTPDRTGQPCNELGLLEAHRRGDPEAMGMLLRAFQKRIYAICYRMVRHEHDARDLTQDSMLKIMEGVDSYDGRAKLSTWVIRVTMNCCLSHLRKERLRRHAPIDAIDASGRDSGPLHVPAVAELLPSRRVEQAEMRHVLRRAMGNLDPQMRAVLVLRDMQELEYQLISEVLGVPIGTVKSRLFRARLALRKEAESSLGDPPADHERQPLPGAHERGPGE